MMRNLFLRKASLWPRFHVTVAESLEGHRKAEVIELEVPISEKMREIQNAVLECVDICITELKKSNKDLDMGEWTLDSSLHRGFDVSVRRQLEPIWHRVGVKTRQIVSDLTDLRAILQYADEVSFLYLMVVLTLETELCSHMMPYPLSSISTLYWQPTHLLPDRPDIIIHHGSFSMRHMSFSRQPSLECIMAR